MLDLQRAHSMTSRCVQPTRTLDCAIMAGILLRRSLWSLTLVLLLAAVWNPAGLARRLSAQAAADNATIDKAIIDALRWRSIGPDRGGRSIAVSGVKGRPREAYFGAVGGGLWKTS